MSPIVNTRNVKCSGRTATATQTERGGHATVGGRKRKCHDASFGSQGVDAVSDQCLGSRRSSNGETAGTAGRDMNAASAPAATLGGRRDVQKSETAQRLLVGHSPAILDQSGCRYRLIQRHRSRLPQMPRCPNVSPTQPTQPGPFSGTFSGSFNGPCSGAANPSLWWLGGGHLHCLRDVAGDPIELHSAALVPSSVSPCASHRSKRTVIYSMA